MTLVVVASAKGSPGATSLSIHLSLAFARLLGSSYPASCLVDADPDGGDVALLMGLAAAPSVATLALAGRHGFNEAVLISHTQRSQLLPGVAVLAGVAGRGQRSAVNWLAPPLADAARSSSLPIVVDAGRVGSIEAAQALYSAADRVIVACETRTASIVHTRSALIALAAEGVEAAAVLIGPTREPPTELASALGRPLLAVLPEVSFSTRYSRRPVGTGRTRSLRPDAASFDRLVNVLMGEEEPIAEPQHRIYEHAPVALSAAVADIGTKPQQ